MLLDGPDIRTDGRGRSHGARKQNAPNLPFSSNDLDTQVLTVLIAKRLPKIDVLSPTRSSSINACIFNALFTEVRRGGEGARRVADTVRVGEPHVAHLVMDA